MPETPLRLWRAYVPRWAHDPLSGEGAARFGGRWNAVGQPCIYAALEISTAFAEYNQGFVQHPATLVQLELSGARLADLTDGKVLEKLGVAPAIHRCEWRALVDQGKTPPTYRLAERLRKSGHDGVIYPSFMSPGGANVALWQWNTPEGPRLTFIDPEQRLPRNPASWV